MPRNAAALVDGIADKPTERRPFTPDEQRRILDAARDDRLHVMVVLAHATGLRQSEPLGIRWTDLDLDLDARILRFAWNRVVRTAGVEHRGIHHMRHAYVTMLAEQGVHERVAQQLAGHADARMTREVYTHVTAPMFEAAANAIGQAVDGTVGSSADATGANGSSDSATGSKNGSKATEPPAPGVDPPPASSA